ncbi:MAG: glycosyltransferase [wastewater metagenome]|nr:glycosyltransferase [Candidatus Loosdrechtia aerotolerans]
MENDQNKSAPDTLFKPIKVIDIELSQPLKNIDCMYGYEFIQALVRFHGTPIGSVKIPVADGYCSTSLLNKNIVIKHHQAIVRHLLYDGLMMPSQPGDLHISRLFDIPHAAYNGCLPLVTVAVCTRNRTADLARCLDSLNHLSYPSLDILVVDNAPNDTATEQLVRTKYQGVRYIHEPRPGLNWARNRAITEARGEIIAYTDDDVVVDPGWVRAVAEVFAEDSEVAALVGLVVPYELETDAQILFEQHGSFGRGFERKWYHINRESGKKVASIYGHTGRFGTGANMAYRRKLFDHIGFFDPALDVGTVTNGGGDLEMFFRVLKEGYMLVYEPRAIVRHCHRRDSAQLRAQIATWGTGFQAYLVRSALAYPDERFALIRLGLQKICYGCIRSLLFLLIRKIYNTQNVFQTELQSMVTHHTLFDLFRYRKARRTAAEIENVFGPVNQIRIPETTGQQPAVPYKSNAIAVRTIDLSRPLHALTDITDYNHVRIFVTRGGNLLGMTDIANYHKSVGPARLRDALIDSLGYKLLETSNTPGLYPVQSAAQAALVRFYSLSEDQTMAARIKLSPDIPVSVVVRTYGQSNSLRDCLRCLVAQESSRHVDITVVNNSPALSPATSVIAEFPDVVLVNKFRNGRVYACNKDFMVGKGDIIIVIDDTVTMPADWLEKLVAPFARSDVMIVAGNVLPQELETTAQILFEKHFGQRRGFEPIERDGDWFKSFQRCAVPVWDLGSMTNVAFRAAIFNHPQIGLTDEMLSTDIPVSCGGDPYLFYRVLKTGYTLIYEPSAFVWYKYHRDVRSLCRWIYHYSKEYVVYHLTTLICDRDLRTLPELLIKIPKTHFRRFIQRLYGKNKYPLTFFILEAIGNVAGPFALLRSVRYGKCKGKELL